ncbi:NYN domain-containing protein [Streptoalloteichus hindustanus]|uniref:Predicted RNA-binding protein containing a PIN domain n=1 Tax=Streptoalloteichus hindustanus TaxID=2017 RepID=A0A1M5BRN4_STRHI|nr:NYN domain-containing protein [Streptoalloteichus hindustanus]SHF45076.1 Predicted RNA-binding protein containing a PIN domain [Streptoalloteichus hindustanus]
MGETAEGQAEGHGLDWAALPEQVRARLAEIAAAAVGGMARADVPASVRPVARFAPAKRARLGAGPLLNALRESSAFRVAVTEWAREHRPEALDAAAPDPVAAAAAGVLSGDRAALNHVEVVARRAEDAQLRAERDSAVARADKLAAEVDRLRAELAEARGAAERVRAEGETELERLRRRLREQGVRLRQARDDAEAARAELDRAQAAAAATERALAAERDRERERAEVERARAARAEVDAEVARQSAREARQADEVRLALLVDTLAGAVTGLRRELALGGSGPRPADLVRGATAAQGTVGRVEDPAALDRLLALPSVHVVVDGYNVTKTGYPELTLADQRERLANQLAALAARTGAEVTVVFDGAGVVAVPAAGPRGVRVLFSDPGVLADDVIRALVTAEPEGRPVVVVTSDRAVADSVRRRGAHPVPSSVLLARLGRV